MEMAGCKIDNVKLNDLSREFSKKLLNIEKQIYQNCGTKFNIGSPKQLGEILFEKLTYHLVKGKKWELSNGCENS